MNREQLLRLQERLVEERARILADPNAHVAGERLPPQLISKLAEIDSATRTVAAELARHPPMTGQGLETNREDLLRLQERLVEERARILADPNAHMAGERLPPQLISKLAEIDSATRAVAAELARHIPSVGRGSET
jgi:hypothetical protein